MILILVLFLFILIAMILLASTIGFWGMIIAVGILLLIYIAVPLVIRLLFRRFFGDGN